MDPVRITYDADKRFVRQVAAANLDRRARVLTILSGVAAFVVAYSILEKQHVMGILAGIAGALIAGAAIAAQRPSRDVARALRMQFQSLPAPATIEVTLDEDGLEFENAHGAQHLPWSAVRSVHRTKDVWFVHTTTDQSLPIPVHAVTPEAEALLREHAPTVTDGTVDQKPG